MKTTTSSQTNKGISDQAKNKALMLIANRCLAVREELNIKRRIIGEACGVTYQQILNFEVKGQASMATVIFYVNYLHEVGKINPAWIFLQDNTHISKVTRTYNDIAQQVQALVGTTIDEDIAPKKKPRSKR